MYIVTGSFLECTYIAANAMYQGLVVITCIIALYMSIKDHLTYVMYEVTII